MIYSVSEVGDMVDFLKAYPFVTMEQYQWGLSFPMIRIMSMDNTHIVYLTEKQAKMRKSKVLGRGDTLLNDLGLPVFND